MIAHHHGRSGGEVLHLLVGYFFSPALFAVVRIERNEPAIRRQKVQPVAVHAHAAIPYQVSALVYPVVVPQLQAGACIQRIHVIGNREVEDSVHQQRRGLDIGLAHTAHGGA